MTKKELEIKIKGLEEMIRIQDYNVNTALTITQAKKRDYIVRTNYIGKIKDKKIKEDFKNEIKDRCGDNFDSISNKILNYEFFFENKNILYIFRDILQQYEYKQIVLDTYGGK